MDYKDTLLMTKSNFEMRGNLNVKEPLLVENWKENKYVKSYNDSYLDYYPEKIYKNLYKVGLLNGVFTS